MKFRARSMKQALASSDSGIIAEFKRRSPSKGWIKQEARPEEIVPSYVAAGAPPSLLSLMRNFWRKSERYPYSTSFGRCSHYKKRLYH